MRAFGIGVAIVAAACIAIGAASAASIDDTAPSFVLPRAEGTTIALADLRGRVVYVDFWASWCGPCRRSFPWMNEIQQRYAGKGLTVVAINVDAKREDAERFLRQYPAKFAVVYDASGATPRAYDVKAMPSSYLIDRNGKIARIEHGFLDEKRDGLESTIRSQVESR